MFYLIKLILYSKNDLNYVEQLKNIYIKIGYKTLDISVLKEINIGLLKEMLKNKTSIFTGHSGVGKI